jgi:hypothetical protein
MAIGVEVKATLVGDDVARAVAALGLEGDGKHLEVWFFDALDAAGALTLGSRSIILRLRRRKDRWTSTLKLRPAVLARLTGDFAPGSDEFGDRYKVEYDWANRPVLAASMDHEPDVEDPASALAADVVSAVQRRLMDEAGNPPREPWEGILAVGPVDARRWDDVSTPHLDGLRAERWTYLGDRRFLELSLRADDRDEAGKRRETLLADLADVNLAPDPNAPPKTETVLRDLLSG